MWTRKAIAGLVAALAMCAALAAQEKGGKTLTPQDYAEIQQLYSRYAWSIDTRAENGMVYANTFTPAGEFVNVNANSKTVGREKLAEMIRGDGTPSPIPTHNMSNIVIEPSQEGARGGAYLTIIGGEKPAVTAIGTYQDILVKTSEGWRFKQRMLYLNAMPRSSDTREGEG